VRELYFAPGEERLSKTYFAARRVSVQLQRHLQCLATSTTTTTTTTAAATTTTKTHSDS
jgi:hypothetical protein